MGDVLHAWAKEPPPYPLVESKRKDCKISKDVGTEECFAVSKTLQI